ncbi:hypothetical protein [Streptomyces sp. NPDC046870]
MTVGVAGAVVAAVVAVGAWFASSGEDDDQPAPATHSTSAP